MDDLFLGMDIELPHATVQGASDESIKFLVEDARNEVDASIKHHNCAFVGSDCTKLHIIPVPILPGFEVAKEPHDIDLFRWVPFYSGTSIIDPSENIFTAKPIPGNVSYSFYYAPQRLARQFSPLNRYISSSMGFCCDPWYGNILVVKTIDEGSPHVVDVVESDLCVIRNLMIEALSNGYGFNSN